MMRAFRLFKFSWPIKLGNPVLSETRRKIISENWVDCWYSCDEPEINRYFMIEIMDYCGKIYTGKLGDFRWDYVAAYKVTE